MIHQDTIGIKNTWIYYYKNATSTFLTGVYVNKPLVILPERRLRVSKMEALCHEELMMRRIKGRMS